MATSDSTTSSETGASDSPSDGEDPPTTLADCCPSFNCEIHVSASVRAYKSFRIEPDPREPDTVYDGDFSRPEWNTLEIDELYCSDCGMEFGSEEAAKDHLRTQYRRWQRQYTLPGVPGAESAAIGRLPAWQEEDTITIEGVEFAARKEEFNRMALLRDDVRYLVESSRRQFAIPANFAFDEWEPLADEEGQLTHPDGSPRLQQSLLTKAVAYLARSHTYDPDAFTLYDRGESPFLLTGYGEAIAIAPIQKNSR